MEKINNKNIVYFMHTRQSKLLFIQTYSNFQLNILNNLNIFFFPSDFQCVCVSVDTKLYSLKLYTMTIIKSNMVPIFLAFYRSFVNNGIRISVTSTSDDRLYYIHNTYKVCWKHKKFLFYLFGFFYNNILIASYVLLKQRDKF